MTTPIKAAAGEVLADRIAAYLDDAPHDGGHSDAAGANSWELLQEAMDDLRLAAQSASEVSREEIAQIIDPDAFEDAMLQDDLTPTERMHYSQQRSRDKMVAFRKANAILSRLSIGRTIEVLTR